MACHCSGCQRSKRIGEIRAKQAEDGKCIKKLNNVIKKNPISKKILMDRYYAARKWLKWEVERYHEHHLRRLKDIEKCMKVHAWVWIDEVWDCPKHHWYTPNPHALYVEWFDGPIKRNGWGVKKYRDARAECKKRGLL